MIKNAATVFCTFKFQLYHDLENPFSGLLETYFVKKKRCKNLFRLKKGIDDSRFKDVKILFRLKKNK